MVPMVPAASLSQISGVAACLEWQEIFSVFYAVTIIDYPQTHQHIMVVFYFQTMAHIGVTGKIGHNKCKRYRAFSDR